MRSRLARFKRPNIADKNVTNASWPAVYERRVVQKLGEKVRNGKVESGLSREILGEPRKIVEL